MRQPAARVMTGPDMFTKDLVRLAVRDGSDAYLMPDGTWRRFAEGEASTEVGLLLPAGVVEAIAIAIAEWQGHTSHADTEARVLREWLGVERARVDKALDR